MSKQVSAASNARWEMLFRYNGEGIKISIKEGLDFRGKMSADRTGARAHSVAHDLAHISS
jgi:hypothetical protein